MPSYDSLICTYRFVLPDIKTICLLSTFQQYMMTLNMAVYAIEVKVIGVRQKYTMLQSTIPITLLQNYLTVQLTTLDKMVHVVCALVNLSESIIPPD